MEVVTTMPCCCCRRRAAPGLASATEVTATALAGTCARVATLAE